MQRDLLFLLKPNLKEAGRVFHCPECATVEGVLAYHPSIRYELEVKYVDFARPRPEVIALLGEAHQGCPVLIIRRDHAIPSEVPVQVINGLKTVSGPREISLALAAMYGASLPH